MSALKRIVSAVFVIGLLAPLCIMCVEDDDLGKITQDMRDRLGDALGFDGGEYFEGPPPVEHAGNGDYPQITDFEVPDSLEQGDDFEITLLTDFSDIGSVKGAVVYVEDAANHIRIQKELLAGADFKLMATGNLPGGGSSGGHMVLTGTVTEEMDDLWGHNYSLFIALLTTDDEVGNYVTWKLELPRLEKEGSEGEGEGEGEGETDGDYMSTVFLHCKSDEFDCSDSDAREVWDVQNNTANCNSKCPTDYDTAEEAQEYVNCVSCCFKHDMTDVVDQDKYKECWACFYYVYNMDSGENGTTQDAYTEAQGLWDSYSETAEGCKD